MNHQFVNSDPASFDSNCSSCGGKDRDAVHSPYRDSEYIENPDLLPFCACGRRVSECDGSRTGCRKPAPYGLAAVVAREKRAKLDSASTAAAAIAKALTNARAATKSLPDDGTCNLDSVRVKLGRCSKRFEQACKAVGVDADRTERPGTYNVSMGFGSGGQANRNTRYCEAAVKELTAAGIDARVCYYID